MDFKELLKLFDFKCIIKELDKLKKRTFIICTVFFTFLLLVVYLWVYPLNPVQSLPLGIVFIFWCISTLGFLIKSINAHCDLKDKIKEEKEQEELKTKMKFKKLNSLKPVFDHLTEDKKDILKEFVNKNSTSAVFEYYEARLIIIRQMKDIFTKLDLYINIIETCPNLTIEIDDFFLAILKLYFACEK